MWIADVSSCYQYVSGFFGQFQHDLNIIEMNLTSASHQALTKREGTPLYGVFHLKSNKHL